MNHHEVYPEAIHLASGIRHQVYAGGGPEDGSLANFYTLCDLYITNVAEWREIRALPPDESVGAPRLREAAQELVAYATQEVPPNTFVLSKFVDGLNERIDALRAALGASGGEG